MSDLILLEKYIEDKGKNINLLADQCGIPVGRLLVLLSGKDEFKASEMMSLSMVLCLTGEESERVFFGPTG